MPKYRLAVRTGPLSSKTMTEIGRKVKKAGLKVVSTGTEHLYVDVTADDCAHANIVLEDKLTAKFGKGMRWLSKPSSSCTRRKVR